MAYADSEDSYKASHSCSLICVLLHMKNLEILENEYFSNAQAIRYFSLDKLKVYWYIYTICTKGNKFCGFSLTSLTNKALLKWGLLLMEKICS